MSSRPKPSAIQQSRAILDRLSRLKQFTGTAAAIANHGWKLDGNGSAIVELVPGGTTADGPAEPYGQLICVGEVSAKGTQVKPEGNYYPDSRNPLKKSKQVIILACPDADSVLKPAWDITMDTLHQMERNICSGESAYFFHNDRGRRCLRFTMPVYMARNNNDAPPMMDNARYKVPAFMRKDFEELIQTHDVRLMAVYDINENLVPYEDIEKTIVGAVVEITFRLLHYAIPRDGGITNSLTGEITQIVVLREPRARAPTGFSRNRVYRPEPSMPGTSAGMAHWGPVSSGRVEPHAAPPSFDYHAPSFNAVPAGAHPAVPAYTAINSTYGEARYSASHEGSPLSLPPRPAPYPEPHYSSTYDEAPVSTDPRAGDPHHPKSAHSRTPVSAVPSAAAQTLSHPGQARDQVAAATRFRLQPREIAQTPTAPVYSASNLSPFASLDQSQPQDDISSAAAQSLSGPEQAHELLQGQAAAATHFRLQPRDMAQTPAAPVYSTSNLSPFVSRDQSQPQYDISPFYSQPVDARMQHTLPPPRALHDAGDTGLFRGSTDAPSVSSAIPGLPSLAAYMASSKTGPDPPARAATPYNGPPARPNRPTAAAESTRQPLDQYGAAAVRVASPRSVSRAGTPGTLPLHHYAPLQPSPLSKDAVVAVTSLSEAATGGDALSLAPTHNDPPVGTMSGESASSIHEQRGSPHPVNLFDDVEQGDYTVLYGDYGAGSSAESDKTLGGFIVDDEAEETDGGGDSADEEEPQRGGKRRAQPLQRIRKRARAASSDDD